MYTSATNLKLVGLAARWDRKSEEHEWLEVHRALLTAVADNSAAKQSLLKIIFNVCSWNATYVMHNYY